MDKIKADIYITLKKNRLMTIASVVVSGVVSLVAVFVVYRMHVHHTKYVYGISDTKELMPLELIEKQDLVEIYRKGSIQLWANYFYNIDQYNYEKQIEKSFWLIGESGRTLYREYQQTGHFNRMIRTSSVQYISDVDIAFGNNGAFRLKAIVTIDRPNQEEQRKYELVGQGRLGTVKANYPLNPYGYLIEDYREVSKTELK